MLEMPTPPSANKATFGYMAGADLQSIAASWQLYKGYTVRPLASTEGYYQSILDRFGTLDGKVLVYGGTPEIRTCVNRSGMDAVIVDRSEMMVHAMGLLTANGATLHPKERVVEGDWLHIPIEESFAAIAMGDDAVNMVSWENFGQFMSETHRLLVPDGLYACHLLVRPDEDLRKQSAADVIRAYEKGEIKSHFDLASRINFTYYDEETYFMGWQRSIAGLREFLAKGEIGSDHGFIERFINCGSQFACPPQEEWEKLIDPLFSIEEVFYPNEHDFCRFEPLYLLKKRPNA